MSDIEVEFVQMQLKKMGTAERQQLVGIVGLVEGARLKVPKTVQPD